jgi:hypothetical protein
MIGVITLYVIVILLLSSWVPVHTYKGKKVSLYLTIVILVLVTILITVSPLYADICIAPLYIWLFFALILGDDSINL